MQRPEPGTIPDAPGVLPVQGRATGRVLYVGKAKSLRSRSVQLLRPPESLLPRTRQMVAAADTVEWIEVRNEVEALFLEYNLIKRHRPRFNIRYKDDKSYPYLAVTLDEEWPRAMVLRGAKRKGVRYFGPYAHAYAIRETLDLLLRTFPIRTCTQNKFDRHHRLGRPCLYAHIEKCAAPCVGDIDREEYGRARRRAARVPRRRAPRGRSTGSTSRCTRRPTRSSSSGRRGCATSSSRSARRSSASRWWRQGGGLRRRSASPRIRSRRRCRCSSCAGAGSSGAGASSSTRSRTSTRPGSSPSCSSSSTATRQPTTSPRGARPGANPRTPSSTRSSSPRRARRSKVRVRVPAARRRSASCSRRSPSNAQEAFAQHKLRRASDHNARGPCAHGAAGRARPARGAAAHRVLRHLEPAGHRDRRRRWW